MAEVTRLVSAHVKATFEHGRAAQLIASAMKNLREIAPELQDKTAQQAAGGKLARAAVAKISEMAKRLSAVQGEQSMASEQTLRAIEELQRAQKGQDEALKSLQD